jgi:hypothetical protein
MAVVEEVFAIFYGMVRQVMIRSNGRKFKTHVRELYLVEEAKEVDEHKVWHIQTFIYLLLLHEPIELVLVPVTGHRYLCLVY